MQGKDLLPKNWQFVHTPHFLLKSQVSDSCSSAGNESLSKSLKAALGASVVLFFEDVENEGHKWIQATWPTGPWSCAKFPAGCVESCLSPCLHAPLCQINEAGIAIGSL